MTLRSVHAEERLVSRIELADMIGCHPDTVDKMRDQGMPHIRWGKKLVKFRPSRALAWLEDEHGVA